MILTKLFYWLMLVLINIPLLVFAAVSTFVINLFNMPFNVWEDVNEFFNNQ